MTQTEATRLNQLIADLCQLHRDSMGKPADPERAQLMATLAAEISELQRINAPAVVATITPTSAPLRESAPEPPPESPTEHPDAYNGWTNYETWCVHLWLSNDAYTDTTAREIVATAWNNAADEVAADREAIVAPHADAADALRDWLRDEENPLVESSNLYTDLLGHALGRVNWYELAEAFQPDPLPSLEPLADPDDEEDTEESEELEEQEGPEPEWWRSERERED